MKTEKCPYCGKDMESGVFRSRGSNYFQPDGVKPPFIYVTKWMFEKGCIPFPPDPLTAVGIDLPHPKGYLCRSCKRVILLYEDME